VPQFAAGVNNALGRVNNDRDLRQVRITHWGSVNIIDVVCGRCERRTDKRHMDASAATRSMQIVI
jgi:hypothetical protein